MNREQIIQIVVNHIQKKSHRNKKQKLIIRIQKLVIKAN